MNNVVRLLIAVALGSMTVACSNPGGAVRVSPANSAMLHPLGRDWTFGVLNQNPGETLHVRNTHRGSCMVREFPTSIDLAPGKQWSATLETKASGSCAFESSSQVITYQVGRNEKLEVIYTRSWFDTSDAWSVSRPEAGRWKTFGYQAPLWTRCNRSRHQLITLCDIQRQP
jgi:hypothetical protein